MRQSRAAFITSVVSGVLAVIALAAVLWTGYIVAACSSPTSQIAQGGQVAGDICALWAVIHNGAVIALVVAGVSFAVATVIYLRSPVVQSRPPPPPPPAS